MASASRGCPAGRADLPKMAGPGAGARWAGLRAGGGAAGPRGRAGRRAAPQAGGLSALARRGPARSEAVAGEGTGGADGRAEEGSGRAKSQCAPRRPGRPPLPGVRRREESRAERTRTGGGVLLGPPRTGLPRLGRSGRGARVPPHTELQPPSELVPGPSEPRRHRAVGGEDDGAAVGAAAAETAGR